MSETSPLPDDPAGPDAEPGMPFYTDVEGWVAYYFAPMFLHRVPGNTRVRWWGHAEAIARLTLLWKTWEAARWEPAARTGSPCKSA